MHLACQGSSAFQCEQQTSIPGETCLRYWKYQYVAIDMNSFTYHHIQTEGGDFINYSFVCMSKLSYTINSLLQKEDTDSKDTLLIFLQKTLEIESSKKSSCVCCTLVHCPLTAHSKNDICMQLLCSPGVAIISKNDCVKFKKQGPNFFHKKFSSYLSLIL